jgi:hypothetical protein
MFSPSGTFTFKNATLTTTLYSVDAAGSMSTNGTIYPGGGLYTNGTVTANSFVEGGQALSSKYLTSASIATTYLKLDGTNYMTGNLGVGIAAQTTTTATIFTPATSTNTGLMIRTNNAATGASILLNNDVDQSATIAFGQSIITATPVWLTASRYMSERGTDGVRDWTKRQGLPEGVVRREMERRAGVELPLLVSTGAVLAPKNP